MRKTVRSLLLCFALLMFAGCAPSEYDVVVHLSDISFSGDSVASVENGFQVTLEADELYRLPQTIKVTVAGEALFSNEYSYDPDTGELSISAQAITGEVEITAEGELITYTVAVDEASCVSIQGDTLAHPKQDYKATLTAQEYYLLPETVSVIVADQILEEGDYSYDASTGELVISADITGDVTVTAEANPVVYELDTSSLIGVTASCEDVQAPTQVMPAFGYTATLTCADGYSLPRTVEVLVDGTILDPSAYTYDPATGYLMIPSDSITGKLEIHAVGAPLIAGDWIGTLDASPWLQEEISGSDPSMAAYFNFHNLYIEISFHFGTDCTGSIKVDEASLDAMFEKLQNQMVDGTKVMLQDLLYAQGLDMNVDDYLTLAGIDLEGMVEESLNAGAFDLSEINSGGAYKVDGNKLFMFAEAGEFAEDNYTVYSLDGDTLIFESVSEAANLAQYLFPMILTRVTE